MRTCLTVIDDQPEARVALRFAARRAAKTGGSVLILALVPPAEFVQWGGVQAAMEEEARLRVEAMVAEAVGALSEEIGIEPRIVFRDGDPVASVRALLAEGPDVAALVLGAASGSEGPGPLVTHFAGAGDLLCPLMIIPGSLSDAALDRLSRIQDRHAELVSASTSGLARTNGSQCRSDSINLPWTLKQIQGEVGAKFGGRD